MALNIAVPLSGVGGLSPISPIDLDCWENIKILCSPIGSESSGVSSLDSEEAKQQSVQQHQPQEEQQPQEQELKEPSPPKKPEDLKILYNGRDILDLALNVDPKNQILWNLRYTYLPENNNIPMFLANRSQYHRLGATGHIQEYSLAKCEDCDFQYPINSSSNFFCQTSVTYSPTTNSAMTYTGFSTINNNHHQNNNHRNHHQNNNKNANNLYSDHINLTDNLFSNSFLKKTTNITNNSTTTTPTMSITPTSLTAATSPTSSGYSSSSSIGKYQSHNNNNNIIKTPTTPISNNNLNSFYSFLNSFNNNTNGGTNNAATNNQNNNGFFNNTSANTTNTNFTNNTNNNFNNNNGFFNGQNYARMYKYF